MNPVTAKTLSWLGAALLVLAVIILIAAVSGIFPQTDLDLCHGASCQMTRTAAP